MKLRKTLWFFIGLIFAGLMTTSCFKEQESATIDEYDVTLTVYDKDFDFETYSTFIVRDSVLIISDYLTDEEIEKFYTNGTSDDIRAAIISKFEGLGHTEVAMEANPDFMISPSILMTKETGVVYYPYWWWGYGGYWGWYGGYYKSTNYYYPPYWGWYPSYGATYYSYKTGTIVMEMADGESVRAYKAWLENAGENPDPDDAPAISFKWTASIDGILSSTGSYNIDRAKRGFNEAFEQSPYLKK